MLKLTGRVVAFLHDSYESKQSPGRMVNTYTLTVAGERGLMLATLTQDQVSRVRPEHGQALQSFGTLVEIDGVPGMCFQNFSRTGCVVVKALDVVALESGEAVRVLDDVALPGMAAGPASQPNGTVPAAS